MNDRHPHETITANAARAALAIPPLPARPEGSRAGRRLARALMRVPGVAALVRWLGDVA